MPNPKSIPRIRILPPAIKNIETAIGMIMNNAQRSGCKNTRIIGIIMEAIKGINPC
jgi:hypothetical protein